MLMGITIQLRLCITPLGEVKNFFRLIGMDSLLLQIIISIICWAECDSIIFMILR